MKTPVSGLAKISLLLLGAPLLLSPILLTASADSYVAPPDGWIYSYEGDLAANDPSEALDGSWSHENGSDAWDGEGIGDGAPGGVSLITEGATTYIRLQDAGDPRAEFPDPGNRKIFFTRDISEAFDTPMDDGFTIYFRLRIATGAGLDDEYGVGPWPENGRGYPLWNGDGKGLITVAQMTGGAQALAFGINDGNLIGTDGASVELDDPAEWSDVWVTVVPDSAGGGTHLATLYLNGSTDGTEFAMTAKDQSDASATYIAMGLGSTADAGAFDIDFFRIAEGAQIPAPAPTLTPPTNAWTLSDSTGTTAAPIVGTASGALENGAEFDPIDGPFPGTGSVVFDGVGAEVNMGEELVFNGSMQYSMSFWIKAATAGADRGFWEPLDNGDSDTWNLRYDSAGATAGASNTIKIGIQTEDGGFDGEFADDIQTEEWQHIVFTYDGDAGEYILYVDGEVSEPTDPVDATGALASMVYFRLGDGAKGHWEGKMSQVAVWGEHVLTEEEVATLHTASLQTIFSSFDPDLDNDEIPDVWEELYGLSNEDAADAASDTDGDSLTALDEYKRGTNPTKADTDGDTLPDNVETDTGTFVGAEDRGTDPNKADTDDDGLNDNVETNTGTFVSVENTGTNPLSNDSDGDGIRDNTEIGLGSDPTDPDSVPNNGGGGDVAYGEPEGGWDESYEGNILPNELEWNHDNGSDEWDESGITDDDGEPGGIQIFTEGDTDFMRLQDTVTSGGTGNNRKITVTKSIFIDDGDPLEQDEPVTLHFRLRLSTGADLSNADTWLEGGDGAPIAFGGKGQIGYASVLGNFGFALGTPDGDEGFDEPALMLDGIAAIDDRDNFFPVTDPTLWQEFWAVIAPDPEADTGTHSVSLWHNGSTEPVVYEVGLTGSADVSGDQEPSLFMGNPATDQIGAFDLDFFRVKAGAFEPTAGAGGPVFQILSVTPDTANNSATLVWTSQPNASYTVEVSREADVFTWLEVSDGVSSEGETTSYTEINIPADTRARYYRVRIE
ncbi:MAG: LamG-like jellyroll fold domain-containing protein [Verrucomicrobiales bacterium]